MRKAWIVARREYLHNIRQRSFLFGAIGAPLFTVVIMLVVIAVLVNSEENVERLGLVGYVDHAGVLEAAIDEPEMFRAYADEKDARQALEDGTLGAYFVVQPDYLQSGAVRLYSKSNIPDDLHDTINAFLIANLEPRLEENILPAERLIDPVELSIHVLENGQTFSNDAIGGALITVIAFSIVFVMAVQISGTLLMSGVVEEKTNRIMEILVTSITPVQLLVGKIVGLGLLGLTQVVIWLAVSLVTLSLLPPSPLLEGVNISPELIIVSLAYFILTYFLLASLMAGIGSVVAAEQESRQYAGILSLVVFIPFFFFVNYLTDPDGPLPLALTLVPFTAPISVIMRMGMGTIPAWQLAVSLVLMLATTIVVVWLAARVFRWAAIMVGKPPTPRALWRSWRAAPVRSSQEGAR